MEKTMADTLQRQRAMPGEVVFREGDAASCAYVIESGTVAITTARGGSDVMLAALHAGDVFGEMALLDDKPRSATVRAVDPTTLIVLGRDQVMRKIDGADPLIKLFLRVILRRLRRTSGLVGDGALTIGDVRLEDSADDTALRRLRQQAIEMLDRERSLEQGLERGEFEVFFQPMVSLASGCASGFEAVLRWRLADGSLREPATFVPLAEEAGLIARLTRTVLAGACAAVLPLQDAVTLASPVAPPSFVSLNLSAGELREATLVEAILEALGGAAVEPRNLQVEVTESVLMEDPEQAARVLRRLKSHGITVAVDDFGTGYSSLSYLQHLPIDVLKIDRSFVAALPRSSGSRKIVRAVAHLARELELTTVAEGVERADELALVREYGYDVAQGFLFAPPRPLAETLDVARQRFDLPPQDD
jgi:EAL domain-containing protein (putative c-di-GMP-specific phosphodiesterase class I)